MDNVTISLEIFRKIFVKNSTIDCVSKDKQIENDLKKLCSNRVTMCFISNYIQKKINDLMINEQYRCSNGQYSNSQLKFISRYRQEPIKEYEYSNEEGKNIHRISLNSLIGQVEFDRYTNKLISNSEFSTVKANCYLYSGKFYYEVLLLTNGIMQLGFACTNQSNSAECDLNLEKSFKNSCNSYTYDGNRRKKWNSDISFEYGEKWEIHDVISCCLDLNNCTVSFYRNGKFLGIAFDQIQTGKSTVYFPIINLTIDEQIIVNFGSFRFKYPIEGYCVLEVQNQFEIIKSNMLIEWLFNLILMKCQNNEEKSTCKNEREEEFYFNHSKINHHQAINIRTKNVSTINVHKSDLKSSFFYLITSLIMEELESLLINKYIIETCLFKHMILYHTKTEIHSFLDIIWLLFDETNLDLFFNLIFLIIVYGFQFSQLQDEELLFSEFNYSTSSFQSSNNEINFVSQKQYLYLFFLLIQHKRTRIYLLDNVLFKKNLFFQLLDTKLIFDSIILEKNLFTRLTFDELDNYFSKLKLDQHLNNADSSDLCFKEYNQNQSNNNQTGRSNLIWRNIEFENSLLEMGTLQNMIIDTLIFQDKFCRTIFIEKFATFLGELERQFINNRTKNSFKTQISVILSVFHRLCSLIRNQYEDVITCFPLEFFIDLKYCSKNTIRIGGIYSYLEKNYKKEILIYNLELSNKNPLLIQMFILIDHLIKLYLYAVHEQLVKYHNLKELLIELNDSISSIDKLKTQNDSTISKRNSFNDSLNLQKSNTFSSTNQLDECSNNSQGEYFKLTKSVLRNDYLIKGHQYALINSVIFTNERRQDIIWLLKLILKTLDQSSSSGCVFSYLPHYYLVTCLNLCTALRFFFAGEKYQSINTLSSSMNKLENVNQDQEYMHVLEMFALFITSHFRDERIVNNDHKELIAQSLISLMISKQGLNVLENISIENRINLIKKLTQPFENQSWINSCQILLRFWRGCGYAFKKETFLKLSNILEDENPNFFTKSDSIFNNANPSLVFQQLLCDYLISNPKQAIIFLTSLLNQLNYCFSEFICIFQDIQNQSMKPDSIKLCCTFNDLNNALLRVLEMIIHYNALLILNDNLTISNMNTCLNTNNDIFNESESYKSIRSKNYFDFTNKHHHDFSHNFKFENPKTNVQNFSTKSKNIYDTNLDRHTCEIGSKCDDFFSSHKQRNNKSSGVIFLQQLCSTCNQILNRVLMTLNSFKCVRQQITNLDSMNEFNILSSVTAILVELIVRNEQTRYVTLDLLVNDLNFQISSYLYLMEQDEPNKFIQNKVDSTNNFESRRFDNLSSSECLDNNYISNSVKVDKKLNVNINFTFFLSHEELEELKKMLIYIVRFNERIEKLKSPEEYQEDELCSICYANKKNVQFIPCLHQICGECINKWVNFHCEGNVTCPFCRTSFFKIKYNQPI